MVIVQKKCVFVMKNGDFLAKMEAVD